MPYIPWEINKRVNSRNSQSSEPNKSWTESFDCKVKVKDAQWCPTPCNPMDCIVHGILQARILEWVTFSSPGDLPNPGIKPRTPTLQVDSLPAEPQGKPFDCKASPLSGCWSIYQKGLRFCYPRSYLGRLVPSRYQSALCFLAGRRDQITILFITQLLFS